MLSGPNPQGLLFKAGGTSVPAARGSDGAHLGCSGESVWHGAPSAAPFTSTHCRVHIARGHSTSNLGSDTFSLNESKRPLGSHLGASSTHLRSVCLLLRRK